ncbi:Uncharacterised protein [Serratia proteamaculans]|nr:Uncharacterised protein [Serratia proteamaculans]CAI1666272.1 Uncharacterised protein [Serratia proteamaculans]
MFLLADCVFFKFTDVSFMSDALRCFFVLNFTYHFLKQIFNNQTCVPILIMFSR